MIYVISDTHFNHDKEFVYKLRGFSSIEEMNNAIIKNWNNTVSKDDEVYMLGDFFLGMDMDYVEKTLNRLNGNIHLIIGNHDTPAKMKIYEKASNVVEITWATQIRYKNRTFYLSHYPTLTADVHSNPKIAVYNLFGHTHSKDKYYEGRPYMYNVACDCNGCKPVSIKDIYDDIDNEIKRLYYNAYK